MFNFINKVINDEFIVIDSQFPQKNPLGFRNSEINEYIKRIDKFSYYNMYPMKPGPEAWFSHSYGVSVDEYNDNKNSYLKKYPFNGDKINYLDKFSKYKAKLAYSFFLAETYVLLPFLNKNKIPFIFVLYPGGGFGLNNSKSDLMLMKIFSSPFFRKVIVTQDITRRYLLDKNLCDETKISYIYGGFVQFTKKDVLQKKYYKKDKKTFDICFVSAKYSCDGRDKGYDYFIKIAKRLSAKMNDVRFHVVGGFSDRDIDVTEMKDKISFYGYQKPDWLVSFYSSMDIFLSPNQSNVLFQGSFDGFPLGIDAAYCGVALLVCDDLNMNRWYINDEDIIIINRDLEEIEEKVIFCYNNLDRFYNLSRRCCNKTQQLFDIDYQISERLEIFRDFLKI